MDLRHFQICPVDIASSFVSNPNSPLSMIIYRPVGIELVVDDHVIFMSDRVNLDTDGPATWQGNGHTIIYSPYKYELIGPEKLWDDKKGAPFAGVVATRCSDIALGKPTHAHMITLSLCTCTCTMLFLPRWCSLWWKFLNKLVLSKRRRRITRTSSLLKQRWVKKQVKAEMQDGQRRRHKK